MAPMITWIMNRKEEKNEIDSTKRTKSKFGELLKNNLRAYCLSVCSVDDTLMIVRHEKLREELRWQI